MGVLTVHELWRKGQTTTWSSRSTTRTCSPGSEHFCKGRGRTRATIALRSLSVDPVTRQPFVGGEPADLTPPEFATIEVLVRSSPAVVSSGVIARLAWPEHAGAIGPGTVEIHMARLRAKLARSDARIETLPGAATG